MILLKLKNRTKSLLKASQINGGNGIKTVVNSIGFIMNSRGVLPHFKKTLAFILVLFSVSIASAQVATNQTVTFNEDTTVTAEPLNITIGGGGANQLI